MPDIRLITYDGSTVTPKHDALLNDAELTGNGILYGCEIRNTQGTTTLQIGPGVGVIYGREFEITGCEINVPTEGSESVPGQLYIHIDLNNTSQPVSLVVKRGSEITTLVDNPDINTSSSVITDYLLCTFNVGPSGIDNLEVVAERIDHAVELKNALSDINNTIDQNLTIRIGSSGQNISNDTKYRKQGIWYFSTANAPTGRPSVSNLNDGILVVIPSTKDTNPYYVKQFWLRLGSQNSTEHEMYVRTCRNNSWGTWERYITEKDFSSLFNSALNTALGGNVLIDGYHSATANSTYVESGHCYYWQCGKILFINIMDLSLKSAATNSTVYNSVETYYLFSGLPTGWTGWAFLLVPHAKDYNPVRVKIKDGKLYFHYSQQPYAGAGLNYYCSEHFAKA